MSKNVIFVWEEVGVSNFKPLYRHWFAETGDKFSVALEVINAPA
jgi:hypothetical protein